VGTLPADACPFSRPFPEDFSECSTYDKVEFRPATLANAPLTPSWTCAHLGIGAYTEGFQHKYGRCALGDATARLQWLKDRIASRKQAVADSEPARGLT
jgi:hypothetical protein